MSFQSQLNQSVMNLYNEVGAVVPEQYQLLLALFIFAVLIALYSIFMWKFCKFFARRDIINLDLNQYNQTEHPVWNKFVAVLFFFIEYILILPILTFLWFLVTAIVILVMTSEINVERILLISAAIVGAIRILAYFNEELSEEIAASFPFTLLVVFLIWPSDFKLKEIIEKITEIPSLFMHVLIFLVFIIALEFLLRIIYLISPASRESGKERG